MTADNFFTQHRIRTDGYGGLTLNRQPSVYLASLVFLNGLRTLNSDTGLLEDIMYETPGFAPGSMGPAGQSPVVVGALNRAMDKYRAAFNRPGPAAARLVAAHAAQDEVNMLRSGLGYGPMVWLTDFELVAERADDAAGELARFISSERRAIAETGQPTEVGSCLPWFDTVEAFRELNGVTATGELVQAGTRTVK